MPEVAGGEFWKNLKPITNSFKPDALPEVHLSQAATDDDRYYVPFTAIWSGPGPHTPVTSSTRLRARGTRSWPMRATSR
ncbi:hypothetical protein OG885_04125 [Streptomyces sp. NBC_00028]|uniref:hypothetical protein n=1 Tax=Streptomyces sp. NBC_00028 TaxID=2975624 RepID=UPI0032557356